MKKLFRNAAALALAAALLLSLAACGKDQESQPEAEEPVQEEPTTLRVGALKGPTAMGLVELMKASDLAGAGEDVPQAYDNLPDAVDSYTFTLAASATELAPQLVKGDLDIACVPANLAASLYQQTEGQVVTLGINTLGVLYIVENGNAVQSLADLEGKTMVASGKDSTPEYALRYLLEENGVDPDTGVVIDWKNEHSECVSALASGAATIALLPQPFVTVAESKMPELRTALDLTAEWDALDNGSALITGVVVARRDVAKAHPQAMERFLEQYAASVDWVNANTADAAALIGEYGIVDAAVAEKALPACNIVCITGNEMKEKLSGYLQVLCDASADSVGGAMPGDDFYYGAE